MNRFFVQATLSIVLGLVNSRIAEHVKGWAKYLLPLRDGLLKVYPVSQYPVQDDSTSPPPPKAMNS